MLTYFITANDTDSGKTRVAGALAKYFAGQGRTVQVVKPVECGHSHDAEAAKAQACSGRVSAHTFYEFPEPMAPMADENRRHGPDLSLEGILQSLRELPAADIRLIEGAGGIAVPIDSSGADWRDFAEAVQPDGVIAVVDDRLGAINQGRMLHAYLGDLPGGFVLNAAAPVDPAIQGSNSAGLLASGIRVVGRLGHGGDSLEILDPAFFEPRDGTASGHAVPLRAGLERRKARHAFRTLSARPAATPWLNLADNDYLGLSRHPEVIATAREAVAKWGTSSSASPLITGYTAEHAALEKRLGAWYGDRAALVWNSGYAANQSVLKLFVRPGDLVLADRLIHNSLIAGILQSGARLVRFPHNDPAALEALLEKYHGSRAIHLVTESVYSMDGDYPDLEQIARLKAHYGFQWFLDEAHAVGWYGETGSGLAEAAGVLGSVDILTGTLGKALASCGAYTVFREPWMRDYCINEGGEFIYSTYLPPSSVAAARAAVGIVQSAAAERAAARQSAKEFRDRLRGLGLEVLGNDSPIVPVICGESQRALALAGDLLESGLKVAAIRPPTVPEGAARIRLSLKSTLGAVDYDGLLEAFERSLARHG